MSVEAAAETYRESMNISLKLLYDDSYRTCDDTAANTAWMLAEYMNKRLDHKIRSNECTAVVAVGCGGFINPAYLAKEWNVPIFSTGVMQQIEVNPIQFPSAIALSGTYEGFATVFMQLFRMNRWYHVTALLDTAATNVIYVNTANTLQRQTKADASKSFQFQILRFNATRFDSVQPVLDVARTRSRIIILFCHAKIGIEILRLAESFQMVNKEYVYLMLQPSQVDIYGKLNLFSSPPASMSQTFTNFIYLTTHHTGGSLLDDLNQRIANRTLEEYNISFTTDAPPLDLYGTRGAYDAVSLWTAAVNRSSSCDGISLASKIKNHLFDLETGLTFIRPDATRLLDMDIYVYDGKARELTLFMWYDSAADRLIWTKPQTHQENFSNPLLNPVRDIPACGFLGTDAACAQGTMDKTTMVILAVVIVVFSLTTSVLATKLIVRHKRELWWLITEDSIPRRTVTFNNNPANYKSEFRGRTVTFNDHPTNYKSEFRGNPVWIYTHPSNHSRELSVKILNKVSALRKLVHVNHDNIAKFMVPCVR
ncbi:guanylate cyclase 2G-like [Paramacrobiotus metropolitanus]|uniref:guanylate cyclase 2G-like n=1 Tax=Paramacrobiotus metropolitanus TaxID=2943436 RepID=UPI0024460825|nr:guanylate cyclase 2G-like [Paramacrobiotus metropolitanus]